MSLVSVYEQAAASAVVGFAGPAIKSKTDLPRDYISNPDYWPFIEEARILADDPKNVGPNGDITFEAWNATKNRLEDPVWEMLWKNALSVRQFEWALPELRAHSLRRQLATKAEEWRSKLLNNDPECTPEWVRSVGSEIVRMCDEERAEGEQQWSDSLIDYVNKVEQRYERRHEESLVMLGIPSVDRGLGKVRPGELVVISSEAKGGKTTLCYQMIDESCIARKVPTLLISLEMNQEQVMDRLTSRLGHVDSMRLMSGKLNERDFPAITQAASKLKDIPLTVIDDNRQTADSVESICRYYVQTKGVKLVILDYFQLLDNDGGSKRFEQLENFSRRFVGVAKSLEIVFVAISQLNEKGFTAGSRQLEKDCHRLIKIYQGENEGVKVVDLALNRWGPSIAIPCLFYGATHRFQELRINHG
jgi:replicative DNA helicase